LHLIKDKIFVTVGAGFIGSHVAKKTKIETKNYFMNKNFSFLTLSLFVFLNSGFSQSTFQKVYGGSEFDGASCAIETYDSFFVVSGVTRSFGINIIDGLLLKLNQNGDTLWTRTFNVSSEDRITCIKQTRDGGFILLGDAELIQGDKNCFLMKTDTAGNMVWSSGFVITNNNDYAWRVQQALDGGFVFGGYSDFVGAFLVRTDSSGNLMWSKTYTSGYHLELSSIFSTPDTGFIIVGSISDSTSHTSCALYKADKQGNMLWSKAFSGLLSGETVDGVRTMDGGFIMTGYSDIQGPNRIDYFVIKTDSLGDTLWARIYGGQQDEFVSSISESKEGGYLISGRSNSFDTTSIAEDAYVIKIDSLGNVLWSKVYGGSRHENLGCSFQSSDGGYFISGYSDTFNPIKGDCYIIKTDSLGNSNCSYQRDVSTLINYFPVQPYYFVPVVNSIGAPGTVVIDIRSGFADSTICLIATSFSDVINHEVNLNVFPNPADNYFTIDFGETLNNGTIQILNIFGSSVLTEPLNREPSKNVLVQNICSGIYIIKVIANNKSFMRKLIINHHE
jgi:hypothetical protein